MFYHYHSTAQWVAYRKELAGGVKSHPNMLDYNVMGKIEFTNIVIDDFALARRTPRVQLIHILTHIHTGNWHATQKDHLKGLSDTWNYGLIYCTLVTKDLLLLRFPNLAPFVKTLSLERPTTLKMAAELEVTVTLFDANHCAGAVLVLLQGYMGRVLYSGDMRFDRSIFTNYELLYPPHLRNQQFDGCSKPVDVLYVDNTFLNKRFNFPPKQTVARMAVDFVKKIIDAGEHNKIIFGLDHYGKEEIIFRLAEELNVIIVVEDTRYEILRAMGYEMERFTTNPDVGFIRVTSKRNLKPALDMNPEAIGIILSGWANSPSYRWNKRLYCLPYSLHSNYNEIVNFVRSVRPGRIYPIVQHEANQESIFYAQKDNSIMPDKTKEGSNYEKELEFLRDNFCSDLSPEFHQLVTNMELQTKIVDLLKPPPLFQELIGGNYGPMAAINLPQTQRKRYQLKPERNQQEITRLKNRVRLKQIGNQAQVVDSDGDQEMPPEQNLTVMAPEVVGSSQDIISASPIQEEDPFNKQVKRAVPQSKPKTRRSAQPRTRQRGNSLAGWMHHPMGEIIQDSSNRVSSEEEDESPSERSRSRSRNHKKKPKEVIDLDLDEGDSVEIVGGKKK